MTAESIARLAHAIRERCAFRPHDTPDYAAADELRALLAREAVAASPAQREELERMVRQGTGTLWLTTSRNFGKPTGAA